MRESLEAITRLLPMVTAVCLVAAITYALGYFQYIDAAWLRSLSLFDLFALSWQALPFTLLGFVTAGFGRLTFPAPVTDTQIRQEWGSYSPQKKLAVWAAIIVQGAVFIGSLVFVIGFTSFVPPDSAELILPAITVSLASLILIALRLRDQIDARTAAVIIFGGALVLAPYSSGIVHGAGAITSKDLDRVILKEGPPVCSHVVYTGERGVIVADGAGEASAQIRWESIEAVIRRSTCRPRATLTSAVAGKEKQKP